VLVAGADLANPTTAAAQASAAQQVLQGYFDIGFGATIGGRTSEVAGRIVSAEAALLGKVEGGPAGEQAQPQPSL
jgi:hypothetical protein